MLKRHLIFTVIFLIVAGANVFAEFDVIPGFSIAVKPLICISLLVYLIKKANIGTGFNRLICAALILSFLGDCLLLFAGSYASFFIYGLIAFLTAHILYSFAFFRDFKNDPQASKAFGHAMLFAMGIFSLSYYSWIRDSLGELRIPVMAYMFVISIMAILAGYRYKRVNPLSFRLVYIGAAFFIISDSVLAYNKFVAQFPFSGVVIITTYMIAQYLITIGVIERIVATK